MSVNPERKSAPSDTLIRDLLDVLDKLSGLHPGFRPVHAKGVFCSGTFTPSAAAAGLTRAPHVVRPSTPIVVRFSNAAGLPDIPDNAPNGVTPVGMAIRFYLADHVHTDVIGHSVNGFPVHTGEQFLEMLRAVAASGPDATKPTPLDSFLAKHPTAVTFLTAPKPVPASYAKESFFGVTAFKFTNKNGESRFGRFRVRPQAGNEFLTPAEAEKIAADYLAKELSDRLTLGAVKFRILVQLAEVEDNVSDATAIWPDSRDELDFGTIDLERILDQQDPEIRKIIFDPVPRVDGIDPSDDPLIEVRAALYLLSGRRRRAAVPS